MPETNAFKMIETLLDEKINADLENELAKKKVKPLPGFILDQLSMKFGLKTLAVKNIISMKMGFSKNLKSAKKSGEITTPYTEFLMKMLGISDDGGKEIPPDEIDLVVKARAIFIEAIENYKRVMAIRPKAIQDKMKTNIDLLSGGEWSILEVIDLTTLWIQKDKELLESFIPKIQPIRSDNEIEEGRFLLMFSLMKIWNKIAKLGKDVKYLYQTLDKDGGGTLDPQEILDGLKSSFNIYFAPEEVIQVMANCTSKI